MRLLLLKQFLFCVLCVATSAEVNGADTTPPTLLSASSVASPSTVILTFDEPLAASAATVGKYTLSPATVIQNATLSADLLSVTLTIATPMFFGISYTVTATNIDDLATPTANTLLSANATFSLVDKPTSGLLAYYTLNESGPATDVLDSSGNNRTATRINDGTATITNSSPGLFGNAYQITADAGNPGQRPRVEAPLMPTLRSVSMWVKTSDPIQQAIFDKGGEGNNNRGFMIYLTADNGVGNDAFTIPPTNTAGVLVGFWADDLFIPGLTLKDGAWHNITVSWDGDRSVRVGIDGTFPQGFVQQQANGDWSALTSQPFTLLNAPTPDNNPVLIGASDDACWGRGLKSLNGSIDEVRIFDRALTIAEIVALGTSNFAPVVDAGADQTVTYGTQINLAGTASDDGNPIPPSTLATQWIQASGPAGGSVIFGDASQLATTATFSGVGTYVLRLTASDGSYIAANELTVAVSPATPTITPSGPTTFCAGGSVTLTSSASLGNQWYLNGNPIGGATNQQYVTTASGDYTVVDTELGLSSASSAVTTVTVNPIPATPTITTSGPTVFEPGGSVTLMSSTAAGNQWFLNGNPIVGASSQTYVANASGNFTVVDTALGCSSASSAVTTVTVGKVTLSSGPTATPNPAGVGQTVTFSAVAEDSNGAALTLSWDIAGTSATGASPTRIFTAPGTYTATVTATDSFGLFASGSVQVTVVSPAAGTGSDSDGDGFSDDFEIAAGTSPVNAADSPTGGTAPTTAALIQSKLSIKLNFAKAASDSILFRGTLPIAERFNPAGQTVTVDVGGAVKAIKLDAKGKSSAFKLSIKKKRGVVSAQTAKFSVKLAKGSFATSLADEGLVNDNVSKLKTSVLVRVVFNGVIYQASQAVTYTAKAGKTGSAKVPR